MARGTQLLDLIEQLQAETGQSTSTAVGLNNLPALKQTLRRTQESLYDKYDWSFLQIQPFKTLSAGQRYYDLPEGLNPEQVEDVALWYNSRYYVIERGIGPEEYDVYNSDENARSTPVERYDIKDNGGSIQFEVWPVPSDNTQKIQFFGKKALGPLVDNADTATLDDTLIVLFAASEILARQKSADAQLKLAAAQDRFTNLKARDKTNSPSINMAKAPPKRRPPITIRVS